MLILNGEPVVLDELLGISRLQEVLAAIVQQLNTQDERIAEMHSELSSVQSTQACVAQLHEGLAEMEARISRQDQLFAEVDERSRMAKDLAQASRETVHAQARPTVRPRILGLGSPMRRLPEEDEEDEDDSGAGLLSAQEYTATAMPMVPLSPIKEVESPHRAASISKLAGPDPATTLAAAVAAAKSSSPQERSPSHTPQQPLDVSNDSVPEPCPEHGGRSSKVVAVNGIPYTQLNTIGRGGSSKVYLVQNAAHEIFALKRVTTENSKQLEAFQNEVVLLQQLRDRDSVIQVVDAEVDREKGRINIVMEAGDMDLGRFLQSQPRLDMSQIQHLWKQMLEAVQVIHQERIVHSDLKPGNFLLINGRLKVIDFGIAKRISNDTTNIQRDASVGTLSYMAPEAVKQGQLKLGRASDIWSLGIILYQMIYGHPPLAHLEPMQRLLRLNDPTLRIELGPTRGTLTLA
ncbi:unnamed protein product [Effrenium voratum]|uniref:Protein kinase domain-containing protein n=1 Tax=Effrenium voratum TaxID=2562239 RepID=A0AA36IPF5_9DINO|nr:unnamed protein product [Effrenium voratum]